MDPTHASDNELVVTRVLDAPCEAVFKAWTEPERLRMWRGPKGSAPDIRKLELRPGGMLLGGQRTSKGRVMWEKFVLLEIEAPKKLVFIQSFSDEEGHTIRATVRPAWPLEIVNRITLTETEDITILKLRSCPLNATEEESKTFVRMRPVLQQGVTGTFERLAAFLARDRMR